MSVKQTIETTLRTAFMPTELEVIDESEAHAGHAGALPEGETHFAIHMVSPFFTDEARVARQRMVFKALKDELDGPVHALRFISLRAPGE